MFSIGVRWHLVVDTGGPSILANRLIQVICKQKDRPIVWHRPLLNMHRPAIGLSEEM